MLKLIALATALSMPGHMPLPPTQAEIAQAAEIAAGIAVASDTAVRTGTTLQVVDTQPPPPEIFAPAGLDNCAEMSWYRQSVGLPASFDGIGWRESNCRNEDGVRTSCCHGYWQIHRQHFDGTGWVYDRYCYAFSYQDVNSDTPEDKLRQACAAKALYDKVGTSAWAATR